MFRIINAKRFSIGRYLIAFWIEPTLDDDVFTWWSDYSLVYISIGCFTIQIYKRKI